MNTFSGDMEKKNKLIIHLSIFVILLIRHVLIDIEWFIEGLINADEENMTCGNDI